ncbi:MAG: zinc ABC transporter substrate-binding protein [Candidatus Omnitrophica bacterium]|nr:zinc ABC transporter substrate-binding protein [Candidatus Omnitrophota bacterium]
MLSLFFLASLTSATSVLADKPLKVVATLSVFADLVKQIGGEDVKASYVASPRFNPHFIECKPSDVLRVKQADLLVDAGLDLEAWRGPLLDAAGNPNLFPGSAGELDLSRGISLLEVPTQPLSRLMGDVHIYGNPHYWMNPDNARIMAQEIAGKLSEVDPANAERYRQRLAEFLKRIDRKIAEWKQKAAVLQGREVVAYHTEWPYFAQFTGLKVEQFLEPKPGIPPSPKHLGFLEGYMRQHKIQAIIQPTYYQRDSSEALARRVGAKVVILCQNVGELPQAKDYFSMIDYNIDQLVQALGGGT